MMKVRSLNYWVDLIAAGFVAFALAGCGGSGGGGGSAGNGTPSGGVDSGAAALSAASALNMTITSASINSPPVVNFTVTNDAGVGMPGLTAADLRFNIAKLAPGSNGGPSSWQNYINQAVGGAVQGVQERSTVGFAFGSLVNHGNGTYSYTFATDITDPAKNPCPAPCTDADAKPLDISFQPGLLHRVTIEQANSAYPRTAGVLDFVPSGGPVSRREVVSTEKCNECHDQLTAHGTRVDTKLCVTCHNRGSWVAQSGKPNVTVDFKTMIHKLHNGSALPSVLAGTPFTIGAADFSKARFPQDVRNCTKCHDGTPGAPNATPQGDNWKTQPSVEACGSCHDDVYFGTSPDPAKASFQKKPHSGGVMTDNSTCALCHGAGRFSASAPNNPDIAVAHNFPARLDAAAAKFTINIISATPTTVGGKPTITFSVTDPTNGNAPYDIKTAAAFTAIASGASRLAVSIGWTTSEFNNTESGQPFGQPIGIDALAASVAGATSGTFTVTSPTAIPAGQTGTLRVTIDGHPAGDLTTPGTFSDRIPVKSVFRDFAITGTATARRVVVDVAKCNVCHDTLSVHGENRTSEPQVCAVCHNPNATDASRRPKTAAGVLTGGVDGKLEESIDFKTMIHGIHAGQSDKGGFRTKGITVYGFGGSVNDFSNVAFPGKLNDCTNCHTDTSYQLTGVWAAPVANGILGSTISTAASTTDPADNLRITPIAAVCSSCHDGAVARIHMQDTFNAANFSATQATINGLSPEACGFCHGPGRVLDVKAAHGVK